MKSNQHSSVSIYLALIVIVWIFAFRTTFEWIFVAVQTSEYSLNGFLLMSFMGYLFMNKPRSYTLNLDFKLLPLGICLFGAMVNLWINLTIDIDILAVFFLVFSSYGLLGLTQTHAQWIASFPTFLLFSAIIPFSYHIDTFIGFPLRVLSAEIVSTIFQGLGLSSVTESSIILIENKVTNIDLPCSGVNGLWMGFLFFLFLTVLEKWRMSFLWFGILLSSMSITFIGNLCRVFSLTTINLVSPSVEVWEIVHIPIGILSFSVSCCLIYILAKTLLRKKQIEHNTVPISHSFSKAKPIFGIAILLVIVVMEFEMAESVKGHAKKEQMVGTIRSEIPLSDKEKDLFLRHGVSYYNKFSLTKYGIEGTAFFVKSRSWRGHHHPEQCIEGAGYKIRNVNTILIGTKIPIKQVQLKGEVQKQAAYWFVSNEQTVDDYSMRVWKGITSPEQAWIMVSVYLTEKNLSQDRFRSVMHKIDNDAKELLRRRKNGTME